MEYLKLKYITSFNTSASKCLTFVKHFILVFLIIVRNDSLITSEVYLIHYPHLISNSELSICRLHNGRNKN